MPIQDDIGYSELTPLKMDHLSKIMAMHLAITQAVLKRHPKFSQQYRYVDLTAGKGFAPDGCKGSPLVFLEQAESPSFRKPYRIDLVEQREENIRELEKNVAEALLANGKDLGCVQFHPGPYEQIVPALFRYQDPWELGLVFVDPSGSLPNFDTLRDIARVRPRMEILIYIATTNVKRIYHITDMLLSDYMKQVRKRHWLIRRPLAGDNHRWTFLLGSDSELFKDYKKIGFLRLDSEEGQAFFPKLNLTKKQRMEMIQPRLL